MYIRMFKEIPVGERFWVLDEAGNFTRFRKIEQIVITGVPGKWNAIDLHRRVDLCWFLANEQVILDYRFAQDLNTDQVLGTDRTFLKSVILRELESRQRAATYRGRKTYDALAESHERLLGDARRALLSLENFKDNTATDPRVEDRYEALKATIEEAEKF